MKTNTKIGVMAGGTAGSIYALLLLLAIELYLPYPNRSVVVIFTLENMPLILFVTLMFGYFIPSLIGAFTVSVFSFLLTKFNQPRRFFIATCVSLATILILPINALVVTRYLGYESLGSFLSVLAWNGHLFEEFLITVVIIPIPSLIYVGISLLISQYLYNQRKPVSNASSLSA